MLDLDRIELFPLEAAPPASAKPFVLQSTSQAGDIQ